MEKMMCTTHCALAQNEAPAEMSIEEQDFSARLLAVANQAALALMISIGHRTSLFEAMKRQARRPAPSWHARRASTSAMCANGWARWPQASSSNSTRRPAGIGCRCRTAPFWGVIIDVEASTAVRQAEVTAAKRMIERVQDDLGIWPRKLIGDTGYGSAEMLAWLVHERDIEPHIPVFDKSDRSDGTFSRADFAYSARRDIDTCPGGKPLKRRQRRHDDRPDAVPTDGFYRYRASKADCDGCVLKPRCCPKADARKVMRSIHEGARNLARAIAQEEEWLVSRRERKKVEMLFAHLKPILGLDRLRLRGPNGARDELHLAAAAQNLRKLAKLIPMQPMPAHA